MPDACRSVISELWGKEINGKGDPGEFKGENSTLIRDKYLLKPAEDPGNIIARQDLFNSIVKAVAISDYNVIYDRYTGSIPGQCKSDIFQTISRLIIGLGGENVLETGITLHHIYGFPIIPATALKGLASHYCDQVWGSKESGFKINGLNHKSIFGTTDDSGHIIFYDAWITPDTLDGSIRYDIMTPHHNDYYSGDGAPSDFDKPIPVSFLSVHGEFKVILSCDIPGETGKRWSELVMSLISAALRDWGVGGKTNAGYGRMSRDSPDTGLMTGEIPVKAKEKVHKVGEKISVMLTEDPKGKGRMYFVANDGFGGFLISDECPGVKKDGDLIKLEVAKTESGGGYKFILPGTRDLINIEGKKPLLRAQCNLEDSGNLK